MKTCNKCNIEKPLDMYYTRKKSKDGLQYYCKECLGRAVLKSYKKNILKPRGHKEYRDQYYSSEKGKASRVMATKKWDTLNAHKNAAHSRIAYLKRKGKLKKQPCQICGFFKSSRIKYIQYEKPIKIMWLCAYHHYCTKPGDINEQGTQVNCTTISS